MRTRERRALEGALRRHYRPGADAAGDPPRGLVAAVAAEMARPARPRAAEVAAEQARRVGARVWALHALLALLAAAAAHSGVGSGAVAAALGSALALASLVGVTRSRSCGMAELEASCPVNAQAAACARGVVLCCADALAVALLALMAGPPSSPWLVLAQGLAPYLAASGAGLLAARRVASPDATVAATVAAAAVCAGCVAARSVCPAAFGPASELAWWVASALALAFAAAQARAWLRAAASGFVAAPTRAAAL